MNWYVFNGTDWRYSPENDDQCTAQQLYPLRSPAQAKGPVDFAIEVDSRDVVRQALPAKLSACVR